MLKVDKAICGPLGLQLWPVRQAAVQTFLEMHRLTEASCARGIWWFLKRFGSPKSWLSNLNWSNFGRFFEYSHFRKPPFVTLCSSRFAKSSSTSSQSTHSSNSSCGKKKPESGPLSGQNLEMMCEFCTSWDWISADSVQITHPPKNWLKTEKPGAGRIIFFHIFLLELQFWDIAHGTKQTQWNMVWTRGCKNGGGHSNLSQMSLVHQLEWSGSWFQRFQPILDNLDHQTHRVEHKRAWNHKDLHISQ